MSSAVRQLVKKLREKKAMTFVLLAFPTGDVLQIDRGQDTVHLSGVKTAANLFYAWPHYSGAPMVLAYHSKNEQSSQDTLVRVFQYLGSVPKQITLSHYRI